MTDFDRLTARIGAANRAASALEVLHRRRQQLLDAFDEAERFATKCHADKTSAMPFVDAMAALNKSLNDVEAEALALIADALATFEAGGGGGRG